MRAQPRWAANTPAAGTGQHPRTWQAHTACAGMDRDLVHLAYALVDYQARQVTP